MRKKIIASVVTGIAIVSLSLTQSYAMGGGGGMGGGSGMGGGGGMNSGGNMAGGTTSSSPSSSSSGMNGNSQQHMTDTDHAAIQNQHMGEAAVATMGDSGSAMTSSSKSPVIMPGGQGQQGNMAHQQ